MRVIQQLQSSFAEGLATVSSSSKFEEIEWFRQEGLYGGGTRLMAPSGQFFNRASVNFSQVQYESEPSRPLNSATALSTIVHPANPHHPSIHMHISWTETKSKDGAWRIMVDLNPSIPNAQHTDIFSKKIKDLSGDHFELGSKQGDQYFFIPALDRHRGVSHFYLEGFNSGSFEQDLSFAESFGQGMIECYLNILKDCITNPKEASAEDKNQQLNYHTLYFYQVLTLDRGTTSGLLVHDENDVGILGSLPSHIDPALLNSWASKTEAPQNRLVEQLAEACNGEQLIDDARKKTLATVARNHYQNNPEGLDKQARGFTLPTTVSNHQN